MPEAWSCPDGLVLAVELWEDNQKALVAAKQHVKEVERAGGTLSKHLKDHLAFVKNDDQNLRSWIVELWRPHPLAPWVDTVPGVGAHSVAIIVALLDGDPYIAKPKFWVEGTSTRKNGERAKRDLGYGEPYVRTLSQLRAYCGYGDPQRKRRAGMSQQEAMALGNPRLKKRVHLVAEVLMRRRCANCTAAERARRADPDKAASWSPPPADCTCEADGHGYRVIYDEARRTYLARDWTELHRANSALTLVKKEFLKDLFEVSRDLHTISASYGRADNHPAHARADLSPTTSADHSSSDPHVAAVGAASTKQSPAALPEKSARQGSTKNGG